MTINNLDTTGTTAQGPLLYTGTHIPSQADALERAMVSLNRLVHRKSDFHPNHWIMDSGAFTRISAGRPHLPIREYTEHINRWARCGHMEAAVSQDYMCEPFVLSVTGLSIREHQDLSTRNYLELLDQDPQTYVMPVIQGFTPAQYARHLEQLSPHLPENAWTGVGSLCKRQGKPSEISAVLTAILDRRPDLRIHGFGVKTTALRQADIWQRLYSVDSAAWSYAARRQGAPGDRNSIKACLEWTRSVNAIRPRPSQAAMF